MTLQVLIRTHNNGNQASIFTSEQLELKRVRHSTVSYRRIVKLPTLEQNTLNTECSYKRILVFLINHVYLIVDIPVMYN